MGHAQLWENQDVFAIVMPVSLKVKPNRTSAVISWSHKIHRYLVLLSLQCVIAKDRWLLAGNCFLVGGIFAVRQSLID